MRTITSEVEKSAVIATALGWWKNVGGKAYVFNSKTHHQHRHQ